MSNIFFHYTTLDSLLGILKGNGKIELWLTDIRYVNDPSETKIFKELLNKNINAILYELNGGVRNVFAELFERRIEFEDLNRWEKPLTFISSFSSAEDSTIFWNQEYAKTNGACLEFSASRMMNELDYSRYIFSKVNYEDPDRCSKDSLLKISEYISRCFQDVIKLKSEDELVKDIVKAAVWNSFLSQHESLYKLKPWSHEKEWRIVHTVAPCKTRREPNSLVRMLVQDKFGEHFPKYPDNIEYRVSNGVLIPYLKIEMPSQCISRISIGPNSHETTEEVLENCLQLRGYPYIQIIKSKAKIRK